MLLGLGVNQYAVTFAGSLTSEDVDFKTAGHTNILQQVVGKLARHFFFDLRDHVFSLGAEASATAVIKSHGVGRVLALLDDHGVSLLLHIE